MANKLPTKKQREDYIKFLQKKLDSKNYKNNVSEKEFEDTKLKLAKEKLRLRFMST